MHRQWVAVIYLGTFPYNPVLARTAWNALVRLGTFPYAGVRLRTDRYATVLALSRAIRYSVRAVVVTRAWSIVMTACWKGSC